MNNKQFRKIALNAQSLAHLWGTEIYIDGVRYSVVEKGDIKLTSNQMKYLLSCGEFNKGEPNTMKLNFNKYWGKF